MGRVLSPHPRGVDWKRNSGFGQRSWHRRQTIWNWTPTGQHHRPERSKISLPKPTVDWRLDPKITRTRGPDQRPILQPCRFFRKCPEVLATGHYNKTLTRAISAMESEKGALTRPPQGPADRELIGSSSTNTERRKQKKNCSKPNTGSPNIDSRTKHRPQSLTTRAKSKSRNNRKAIHTTFTTTPQSPHPNRSQRAGISWGRSTYIRHLQHCLISQPGNCDWGRQGSQMRQLNNVTDWTASGSTKNINRRKNLWTTDGATASKGEWCTERDSMPASL